MSSYRPLSTPPINLENQVGIEIGRVLEIEVASHVIRLRKKPNLLWFPDKKALAFFVTDKLPNWLKPKPSTQALERIEAIRQSVKAKKAFREFMGREASSAYTLRVPRRKVDWYNAGSIARLDYSSDKFGAKKEYTHGHGAGVRIYTQWPKSGRAPSLWVIKGGRLTVTARGIVN